MTLFAIALDIAMSDGGESEALSKIPISEGIFPPISFDATLMLRSACCRDRGCCACAAAPAGPARRGGICEKYRRVTEEENPTALKSGCRRECAMTAQAIGGSRAGFEA